MGNLTALEKLDLSFNELTDLATEENIFNLPVNLTDLKLNNNRLEFIPASPFEKAKHLTTLDLRHNELQTLDIKIIDKVKDGMRLYFEGKFHIYCASLPRYNIK